MSAVFTSLNPATQQVIWEGKAASAVEVTEAVARARKVFASWSQTPVDKRIAYVERFKTLLSERVDIFARVIAEDTGKVLWDARGEVQAMIGKAALSVDAYQHRTGQAEKNAGGVRYNLRHRPHGVMAVFGPYNFPGHLPNGHIMPALIAGNTIVFKPSEQTPLVAEAMIKLWQEAGLPENVLNLVQGGRDTGVALAATEIDGLLFTGSAEVGAALHKQFAGRPDKILALEMGGNNPLIVHRMGNAQAAALLTLQSAYLTTGQRCTCARRLIVLQDKEGDTFLETLADMASRITIGAYTDTPEAYMGPLIGNGEADKLIAVQEALLARGATALLKIQRKKKGYPFLTPALIDVTAVREREDKEWFGPLLQVIRVGSMEEALAEANRTRFGLAAGLLSDDASVYDLFISQIRAGVVSWNRPTNGASSALPFGGIGASGNHRPSAYYAADYCAYPVASSETDALTMPDALPPGVQL